LRGAVCDETNNERETGDPPQATSWPGVHFVDEASVAQGAGRSGARFATQGIKGATGDFR
jgi:hypothetical protein